MRNIVSLLGIMVLHFIGGTIGGIWFYIFVPFPLFVLTKIISIKFGEKEIPFLLFPAAFLLLDLVVFMPPELARGVSFDVYVKGFWETLMMAFLVGGIQWGILRGMLFVSALFKREKSEEDSSSDL